MIDWNEDRLAVLRRCWMAGLVAREIAPLIHPDATPSCIRGKIRRLGWERQMDDAAQAHKLASRAGALVTNAARGIGRPPGVKPEAELQPWPDMPGPLPGSTPMHWLADARPERSCSWPVGGEGGDLVVCCLPRAKAHRSYCVGHVAMAHGGGFTCDAVNENQPREDRRTA